MFLDVFKRPTRYWIFLPVEAGARLAPFDVRDGLVHTASRHIYTMEA